MNEAMRKKRRLDDFLSKARESFNTFSATNSTDCLKNAIDCCQEALRISSENPHARQMLSNVYVEQFLLNNEPEYLDLAVVHYKKGSQVDPDLNAEGEAGRFLVKILDKVGEEQRGHVLDLAIDCFSKAIYDACVEETVSEIFDLRLDLADAYIRKIDSDPDPDAGCLDLAIGDLQMLRRVHYPKPKSSASPIEKISALSFPSCVTCKLGEAYLRKFDITEDPEFLDYAIGYFKEVLESHCRPMAAYYFLGIAYAYKHELTEDEKYLNLAISELEIVGKESIAFDTEAIEQLIRDLNFRKKLL